MDYRSRQRVCIRASRCNGRYPAAPRFSPRQRAFDEHAAATGHLRTAERPERDRDSTHRSTDGLSAHLQSCLRLGTACVRLLSAARLSWDRLRHQLRSRHVLGRPIRGPAELRWLGLGPQLVEPRPFSERSVLQPLRISRLRRLWFSRRLRLREPCGMGAQSQPSAGRSVWAWICQRPLWWFCEPRLLWPVLQRWTRWIFWIQLPRQQPAGGSLSRSLRQRRTLGQLV